MPTGGDWTPFKNEATDFAQDSGSIPVSASNVLNHYVRVNGGFGGFRRAAGESGGGGGALGGGGGSGTGGSKKHSAGISVAQSLGGFLSRVGEVGLSQALQEEGLSHLVGRSASEVSGALLDEMAGPGSTLDNAAARLALADVRDELLAGAETFEDVETKLKQALDQSGLFLILAMFFGHYVFERFCRDFYEDWMKKIGESKAAQKLKEVKDYIESSLRAKLAGKKIGKINWKSAAGVQLSDSVLKETLEVFAVTS